MKVQDYLYRNLPRYFPTMYLEGYTPEQILLAAHRDMIQEYATEPDGFEVHIKSEVKKK